MNDIIPKIATISKPFMYRVTWFSNPCAWSWASYILALLSAISWLFCSKPLSSSVIAPITVVMKICWNTLISIV